jgi:aryl-alcohol dehydrogenase-like predicted oxidoreductase
MVDLVLGTAQLGLDYGATNTVGRPRDDDAKALLELALSGGIRTVDTAAAYGDAESRLGNLDFSSKFNVISKLQCSDDQPFDLEKHLRRLQLQSIHGLLFHSASDLNSDNGRKTLDKLRNQKRLGLVNKIGFSAYSLEEIQNAIEVFPDVDLVQVPGNALDFRILDSEIVNALSGRGVEIHVRSVFLQGLLLNKASDPIDSQHLHLLDVLREIEETAISTGQSVIQFLMNQIRNNPNVSAVVIGASSAIELDELLKSWDSPYVESPRLQHNLDYEKLDPRNWLKVI